MTDKTRIPKADLDYLQQCVDKPTDVMVLVQREHLEDAIAEIKLRRASKTAVKKPQSAKTKKKFAEADRREAARKANPDSRNDADS